MEASPGPPAEIAETHISVVAMVGDRAYKLLKPVALGFLDHRTREARLAACRRETEVNRRFAPDVYLGVLDVIDEHGAPVDHLVAMRRMPASRRLSSLLGDPGAAEAVRAVARHVAALHRAAPRSAAIAAAGRPEAVLGLWEEGLGQLADAAAGVLAPGEVERCGALARRYLDGRGPLLERRIADGWVRDGHGDLLADDVFLLEDGPRVLDCLAFDDRLRHGDVLADVAFLAMDLEARGRADLAALLVSGWRAALGERHPASLEHHYVAYRAHVRAKVAALRAGQGDPAAAARARRLHALALARLERAQVRLVLVGGAPGTGKSTLAAGLAAAGGWTVVRSDVVRKDAEGLPHAPADAVPFGEGRYAPAATERVYGLMLRAAADALALGESVVLDASWSSAARREAARRLARRAGAGLAELRCAVPPGVAAERVRLRRARAEGPSDATPAIAERLAAAADPWPEAAVVDTAGPPGAALAAAHALLEGAPRPG
ncbi:AAA family ATPase [Miltoncostaea marina]|uniref:bifunctional aminoglycoside phosphotransferase/ATP-binding protein n=1 Tax=Miltoncostaea marina TaxID=2843215 RepID=UPI001C3E22FD|nr:AAA family ATPase [Miltoncostaea marina]